MSTTSAGRGPVSARSPPWTTSSCSSRSSSATTASSAGRLPWTSETIAMLIGASVLYPSQGAVNRSMPVGEQRGALVLAHPRLEARRLAPHLGDLFQLPHPGCDPGEIGGAERGGLGDLGQDHRDAENVGLELHQPPVRRRAAVRLQELEPLPRRR